MEGNELEYVSMCIEEGILTKTGAGMVITNVSGIPHSYAD